MKSFPFLLYNSTNAILRCSALRAVSAAVNKLDVIESLPFLVVESLPFFLLLLLLNALPTDARYHQRRLTFLFAFDIPFRIRFFLGRPFGLIHLGARQKSLSSKFSTRTGGMDIMEVLLYAFHFIEVTDIVFGLKVMFSA